MITEEQKEKRRSGLFASDVARIMTGHGVEVALQKLGKIPEDDLSDVLEVAIGFKAEPLILTAYEKKTNLAVQRNLDTIIHPQLPWLGCHLDALVINPHQNVEAKAIGTYNRPEWGEGGDEVPPYVMWQVQTQMACTGAEVTDIPVCFVSNVALKNLFLDQPPPINIFRVRKDYDLEAYLIEKATEVRTCIEQGITPKPLSLNDVKLIYPKALIPEIEATDEIAEKVRDLILIKAAKKKAEDVEKFLALEIQAFMGPASQILKKDGRVLATWTNNKDGEWFDKNKFANDYQELYSQYTEDKLGPRVFRPKKI